MADATPTVQQIEAKTAAYQQEQAKLAEIQSQYMPKVGLTPTNIAYKSQYEQQFQKVQSQQQQIQADIAAYNAQIAQAQATPTLQPTYEAPKSFQETYRGYSYRQSPSGTYYVVDPSGARVGNATFDNPAYTIGYIEQHIKETSPEYKAEYKAYEERRAQEQAQLKAGWGGTLTPSARKIVEAPVGAKISDLQYNEQRELQQLGLKQAYLQSPTTKWGSQEAYNKAFAEISRSVEIPKPAGKLVEFQPGELGYHATAERPGGIVQPIDTTLIMPVDINPITGRPYTEAAPIPPALRTRMERIQEGMIPYGGKTRTEVFGTYFENLGIGSQNILRMGLEKLGGEVAYRLGRTGEVTEAEKAEATKGLTSIEDYWTVQNLLPVTRKFEETVAKGVSRVGAAITPEMRAKVPYSTEILHFGGETVKGAALVPGMGAQVAVGGEILVKQPEIFRLVPAGLGIMAGGIVRGAREDPLGTAGQFIGQAAFLGGVSKVGGIKVPEVKFEEASGIRSLREIIPKPDTTLRTEALREVPGAVKGAVKDIGEVVSRELAQPTRGKEALGTVREVLSGLGKEFEKRTEITEFKAAGKAIRGAITTAKAPETRETIYTELFGTPKGETPFQAEIKSLRDVTGGIKARIPTIEAAYGELFGTPKGEKPLQLEIRAIKEGEVAKEVRDVKSVLSNYRKKITEELSKSTRGKEAVEATQKTLSELKNEFLREYEKVRYKPEIRTEIDIITGRRKFIAPEKIREEGKAEFDKLVAFLEMKGYPEELKTITREENLARFKEEQKQFEIYLPEKRLITAKRGEPSTFLKMKGVSDVTRKITAEENIARLREQQIAREARQPSKTGAIGETFTEQFSGLLEEAAKEQKAKTEPFLTMKGKYPDVLRDITREENIARFKKETADILTRQPSKVGTIGETFTEQFAGVLEKASEEQKAKISQFIEMKGYPKELKKIAAEENLARFKEEKALEPSKIGRFGETPISEWENFLSLKPERIEMKGRPEILTKISEEERVIPSKEVPIIGKPLEKVLALEYKLDIIMKGFPKEIRKITAEENIIRFAEQAKEQGLALSPKERISLSKAQAKLSTKEPEKSVEISKGIPSEKLANIFEREVKGQYTTKRTELVDITRKVFNELGVDVNKVKIEFRNPEWFKEKGESDTVAFYDSSDKIVYLKSGNPFGKQVRIIAHEVAHAVDKSEFTSGVPSILGEARAIQFQEKFINKFNEIYGTNYKPSSIKHYASTTTMHGAKNLYKEAAEWAKSDLDLLEIKDEFKVVKPKEVTRGILSEKLTKEEQIVKDAMKKYQDIKAKAKVQEKSEIISEEKPMSPIEYFGSITRARFVKEGDILESEKIFGGMPAKFEKTKATAEIMDKYRQEQKAIKEAKRLAEITPEQKASMERLKAKDVEEKAKREIMKSIDISQKDVAKSEYYQEALRQLEHPDAQVWKPPEDVVKGVFGGKPKLAGEQLLGMRGGLGTEPIMPLERITGEKLIPKVKVPKTVEELRIDAIKEKRNQGLPLTAKEYVELARTETPKISGIAVVKQVVKKGEFKTTELTPEQRAALAAEKAKKGKTWAQRELKLAEEAKEGMGQVTGEGQIVLTKQKIKELEVKAKEKPVVTEAQKMVQIERPPEEKLKERIVYVSPISRIKEMEKPVVEKQKQRLVYVSPITRVKEAQKLREVERMQDVLRQDTTSAFAFVIPKERTISVQKEKERQAEKQQEKQREKQLERQQERQLELQMPKFMEITREREVQLEQQQEKQKLREIQIEKQIQKEAERLILPSSKPPKEDGTRKTAPERVAYKYKPRESPIFGGAEKLFENGGESPLGRPTRKEKTITKSERKSTKKSGSVLDLGEFGSSGQKYKKKSKEFWEQ